MESWILPLITLIPLLGAVIILFIPRERENGIKLTAIAISLVPLVLAIVLMADYYTRYIPAGGGMQYQVTLYTIPALNASYSMGADGLSIPMIFLTTMLTTLGLYYSRHTIKKRVKEFFFLFLLLEMGMLGVFVSLDYVLFYIFWEIGLVPMYFLIGIWGQPKDRPRYAAIKFFIYTLVGSVAMLLAILAPLLRDGHVQHPGSCHGAALGRQPDRRQPGFLGVHAGLHDQGAGVAFPHLAA